MLARNIDYVLLGIPLVLPYGYWLCVHPEKAALIENGGILAVSITFVIPLMVVAIPIEAWITSTWGTTPGKRLLGIHVLDARNESPRFGHAIRRSGQAFLGMGMGIPLISLFCNLAAYKRIRDTGSASWDRDDCRVVHRKHSHRVFIFAACLFALVVGLSNVWGRYSTSRIYGWLVDLRHPEVVRQVLEESCRNVTNNTPQHIDDVTDFLGAVPGTGATALWRYRVTSEKDLDPAWFVQKMTPIVRGSFLSPKLAGLRSLYARLGANLRFIYYDTNNNILGDIEIMHDGRLCSDKPDNVL